MVRPALATVDPILASTLRLPFAGVVMLVAASRAGRLDSRRLELKRPVLLGVALGGLVTVVSATLFLWAVALIGAARTAAIASSSPLFAAPMAYLLFREHLTIRLVLGMLISTAGVVVMVVG